VAGLFITTEAMIADKPKKRKPSARAMQPEDMY
jgi:chaperonin GroEL (HSP60 family)